MPTTTHPGKRGRFRFLAGLTATLHYRGQDFNCEATNLSRSGVLLTGAMPPPEEPDLEVTLESSSGDRKVRLRARVARVAHDDETDETTVGLQFEGFDSEQENGLRALLARVVEGVAPAPIMSLGVRTRPNEARKALEKMTLAHRVNLATHAKAIERSHLKHDPNPQVLDALARNPCIHLQELKDLVRRPQILPGTLEIVANDARWKADDELKIIIATHPRVTMKIAEQVVSRMSDVAIRKVLERSGLHPDLREKLTNPLARHRLMRR